MDYDLIVLGLGPGGEEVAGSVAEAGRQVLGIDPAQREGSSSMEHVHPEDQVTVIVEGGVVAFVVDGVERRMGVGDMAVIPGGVSHSASVAAFLRQSYVEVRRSGRPTTSRCLPR